MDIIFMVKPSLAEWVEKYTLPYFFKNYKDNNDRYFLISSKEALLKINKFSQIMKIDEDEVVEGLKIDDIKKYIIKRGFKEKIWGGWFFQQFIKMGIATSKIFNDSYFIWDGDSVLLKPMRFLTEDNIQIVQTSTEYHKIYYDFMEKNFDLKKQVPFSFISEHFLFKKKYMNEIINEFSNKDINKKWWVNILDRIEDKNFENLAFSEYELYGNYVYKNNLKEFIFRELDRMRAGAKYCGHNPNKLELWILSIIYYYASFEHNQFPKSFKLIRLIKKVLIIKLKRIFNINVKKRKLYNDLNNYK